LCDEAHYQITSRHVEPSTRRKPSWLIAILAVAWLSLRYFEKPLLDYGQKLAAGKPPGDAASPSVR
jgi:hypothetical protein